MPVHGTLIPGGRVEFLAPTYQSWGVNHLSVSNPVFWEKYINMSSAEIFTQSVEIHNQVNYYCALQRI